MKARDTVIEYMMIDREVLKGTETYAHMHGGNQSLSPNVKRDASLHKFLLHLDYKALISKMIPWMGGEQPRQWSILSPLSFRLLCLVAQSCLTLCDPMDCNSLGSIRPPFPTFMCPWRFSRQEYWSGFLCLSPGDLSTQGSNSGLPHCRQILYHLSHQGGC